MDAVILAAGLGSRLREAVPKCLVEIGGRPLLIHQLDALRHAGVDEVTIVVGHRHELVRKVGGTDPTYVLNPRFAETNSLYSFHLAHGKAPADLLVLNGDVLFPGRLLPALLRIASSALAFDSSSGEDPEHMKVCVERGRLHRIGKGLPPATTHGESLGVVHLTAAAAAAAFSAAASLLDRGRERAWFTAALSAIARELVIACVDVAGMPWVEIDFPHDLAAARSQTWPAIEAHDRDLAASPPVDKEAVAAFRAGRDVRRVAVR
jgi:choline kinase